MRLELLHSRSFNVCEVLKSLDEDTRALASSPIRLVTIAVETASSAVADDKGLQQKAHETASEHVGTKAK
jgi:hypothetical protein